MHCFTDAPTNFVDCSGGNPAIDAIIAANNPYIVELDSNGNPTGRVLSGWSPPQKRTFKYNEILPNVGVVFDITPRISAFAHYAKGLSVPSTDNLYNDFFFPEGTSAADPDPETTNSFDGGLRYRSSKIQAQVGVWKTFFKNRTAQAFDPELNASVFRNLGTVDKWGIDGSVAWSPIKQFTGYVFGSLNKSKIKDNIQIGGNTSFDCDTAPLSTPAERATAARNCAFTEGKSESGSPKYTYGASFLTSLGDFDFGMTAKRTGPRYIFDNNQPVFGGDVDVESGIVELFPAKTPAYWLVNLDARYNLRHLVGLEKSYFALNVYNLFDETYVGGFTAGLNQTVSSAGVFGNPPFAQIGAPRTVSGTLSIEF
jgi:iron complex outermembrane receptor protein